MFASLGPWPEVRETGAPSGRSLWAAVQPCVQWVGDSFRSPEGRCPGYTFPTAGSLRRERRDGEKAERACQDQRQRERKAALAGFHLSFLKKLEPENCSRNRAVAAGTSWKSDFLLQTRGFPLPVELSE